MTTRTYGILASVLGTAIGAWWWTRQRVAQNRVHVRDNGTVIYQNTPTPSDFSGEGVI